jgi:hypothetical protein
MEYGVRILHECITIYIRVEGRGGRGRGMMLDGWCAGGKFAHQLRSRRAPVPSQTPSTCVLAMVSSLARNIDKSKRGSVLVSTTSMYSSSCSARGR